MRFLRLSSAVVLAAGIVALAAMAQAQTRAAAGDDGAKVGKRTQGNPSQHAASPRPKGKDQPKQEADDTDMIMLQESFRPSPATPVSITRGK